MYLIVRNIFVVGYFFCSLAVISQNHKTDSLNALLKADMEDTNKVKHLTLLGRELGKVKNLEADSELNFKAFSLARTLNYFKGIANAEKEIGSVYDRKGDFSSALKFDSEASIIYEKIGDEVNLTKVLVNIGAVFTEYGNYSKAIEYSTRSLKLAQKIGDKLQEAYSLGNCANAYSQEGIYGKALGIQLKILQIFDESGNKHNKAICLSNIGQIYEFLNDTVNSSRFYTRALALAIVVGDTKLEANMIDNLAHIARDRKEYDTALSLTLRALKIHVKIKNEYGVRVCICNIGAIYFNLKMFDSSLKYDNIALELASRANDSVRLMIVYLNMGKVYLIKKNYHLAEDFIIKSENISLKCHKPEFYYDANKTLSELYSETGQWQKAYNSHVKFSDTKDTLMSKDKSREIGRLEAKYQYIEDSALQAANFSNQLSLQKVETEKKAAENKAQKTIIWLIASIAVILSLAVGLFFQRMKVSEKKKVIAEQQKAWLELKTLRTQMTPHFLFNAINSIQSFILNKDTQASYNYLNQFSGLLRDVLENSRKEKISLVDEIQGLTNYLEFEAIRFPEQFKYNINVGTDINRDQTYLPPMLIQPYVENAIWHGILPLKLGKGIITVTFETSDKHLKCVVDDNGIGRKASTELGNKKGHNSVGMKIIAERMETMNKMYEWDMSVNVIDKIDNEGKPSGTKAEVFIPLLINKNEYA